MRNLSREREHRSPDAGAFLAELEACEDCLQSTVGAARRGVHWAIPAGPWPRRRWSWSWRSSSRTPSGRRSLLPTLPPGAARPSKTRRRTRGDAERASLLKAAEAAYGKGQWKTALDGFKKALARKDTDEVRSRIKACSYRIAADSLAAAKAERDWAAALDQALAAGQNASSGSEQLEARRRSPT